jgi:Outer membrane lipoprotein carrier protein LolA-like
VRLARACIALGAIVVGPAHGAGFDIESLFASIAREPPARATFHETKFLALLDKPLESSGELVFVPPDRLEKRTLKPRPESVTVDRERLVIERAGKRRSLALRDQPQVAVLVESIRATLAGDLASLTRAYSAALEGTPAKWRLVLRPLDPGLATLVERTEIGGTEAQVRSVEIFQVDGDRSVMTISPAP